MCGERLGGGLGEDLTRRGADHDGRLTRRKRSERGSTGLRCSVGLRVDLIIGVRMA